MEKNKYIPPKPKNYERWTDALPKQKDKSPKPKLSPNPDLKNGKFPIESPNPKLELPKATMEY